MAKTLSGFKVIGDTSKIGAGSKKGSAGQTSPTPSSNGSSRTLGGFKVIGDTSKIGAKAAAKTTQQTGAQSATLTQSTTRYPQPMDNVGRQTGTNSRLLADTKQSGTLIPSLDNGRVGKVISGAAKSVGSAYTNMGGVLAEGAGKLNTRIANQNAGDSLQSDHDAVKRYEKMLRDVKWANGRAMSAKDVKTVQGYLASAKRRIAAHEGYTKAVEQSDKAVADKAYQKADRLSQSSAADVAQAKEGLGPVGQFAVDLGVQGVQMAGDVAASAVIPGAGLALMTARSAGSSAQQSRQAGASYDQQLAYGLGSGALSLATEKISNVAGPFKKAFGAGLADKAAGKLIAKFGESTAAQVMSDLAKRPAGRLALSMISEGGEEFIEDVFQPILQRATYDPSARFDLSEALYDAAVGAAMGGIGGAVDVVRGRSNTPTTPQEAAGAQTDVREGNYAPTEQVGAEPAQNAASGVEAAENIRVGQATTIKKPYKGEVPAQTQRQNTAPVQVSSEALTRAQNSIAGARGLESSFPVQSFKSTLKNVYKSIFKPAKGVVVEGATFNGHPYTVDIGNKVLGKVISDTKLTPEKLALLGNVSEVVQNGTYVGSGEYTQHSGKDRPTIRYDYFETPVSINGESYIAKFDVEVVPGANNYRTHQVVKMDLTPTEASLVGPEPTASSAASSPVEGTRPLNANDSIAQGAENVKNGGAAGFDTPGDAKAGTLNTDYDRLQAAKDKFHPEGAYAARPVDVPLTNFEGRNIPKSASTIAGAQGIAGEDVLFLEQQIADGKIAFDTIQDETAVNHARSVIQNKGFDGALEQYRQAASANVATKDNTALGQQLILQAMHEGNAAYVSELLTLYTRNSTTVAQTMQAQSMFRKLSPEGQLMSVQKAISDLNEKYGTAVELDEADVKDFLDAETPEERQKATEKIVEKAAQSVPGTFRAKYDTLRYLAMLGNPRTHIRNILGNTLFQIPVTVKNRVGAIVEGVASAATGGKTERSKSLLGANPFGKLAAECRADFSNAKDFLEQSSKYNEGQTSLSEIEKKAKAFSDDNLIGKAVNKASDFNSRALEAEDTAAKKWIYTQSMAGYLKANGYKSMSDAPQSVLNRARDYAAQEALRNTFNDKNVISDAVSDLGKLSRSDNPAKKFAGYIVEGMVPFKRTPANIAVRAAEYSLVGAVLGAVDTVRGAKAKDVVQVSKGLDRVATGLSGTALMLAGFLAAGAGYVTGGDDDDDRQQSFNDLTGHQNYALELKNGTSITLDWLAPEAIPFFVGAERYNQGLDQGLQFKDVLSAVKNASAPMLEMSMLQGLNDTFESAAYAKNRGDSVLGSVVMSALTNYVTQAFPTLGGQIERTGENLRMTTYVDKNKELPTDLQYTIGKISQKIPGLDYQQIPYIDAWGRTEATGDALTRTFNNLINPAYVSQVEVDKVEAELQRVKDATGDSTVFPSRAEKSIEFDNETHNLTAEQYQKYAKAKGQNSYKLVQQAMQLPAYKKMGNGGKAEFLNKMLGYANYKAKRAVFPKYSSDAYAKYEEAEKNGVSPAEYYVFRTTDNTLTADKDVNGNTIAGSKKEKVLDAINGMDLSPTEKDFLYLMNGYAAKALNEAPWH